MVWFWKTVQFKSISHDENSQTNFRWSCPRGKKLGPGPKILINWYLTVRWSQVPLISSLLYIYESRVCFLKNVKILEIICMHTLYLLKPWNIFFHSAQFICSPFLYKYFRKYIKSVTLCTCLTLSIALFVRKRGSQVKLHHAIFIDCCSLMSCSVMSITFSGLCLYIYSKKPRLEPTTCI